MITLTEIKQQAKKSGEKITLNKKAKFNGNSLYRIDKVGFYTKSDLSRYFFGT